jgi:hypothetical protein
MWVFGLPWAGWSCEIASEASEVGVGRQELAWYRRRRAELSGMDQDDEPVSLSQGAKFGTFALSTTISPRVRLFDRHPQDFHFPVFHDSGSTDQWVDRIISLSELRLSRWFNSTATSGKTENRNFDHRIGNCFSTHGTISSAWTRER